LLNEKAVVGTYMPAA